MSLPLSTTSNTFNNCLSPIDTDSIELYSPLSSLCEYSDCDQMSQDNQQQQQQQTDFTNFINELQGYSQQHSIALAEITHKVDSITIRTNNLEHADNTNQSNLQSLGAKTECIAQIQKSTDALDHGLRIKRMPRYSFDTSENESDAHREDRLDATMNSL
ncbi:hypothetical protein HMI54_011728 [Coelomomyces lativittatus]|nr:hypothetical protein HMI56_005006 [Coelomomyces lativittatus]KAJ1499472.1 hypothetical protein HMI54_011728 [Coelomomyces lativittatus]